jgi:hypothetical protein
LIQHVSSALLLLLLLLLLVVVVVVVVVVVAAAATAIAVWEEENLYKITTLSFQHFSGTRVQQKSHLIIHTIGIITKNLLLLLLHKI